MKEMNYPLYDEGEPVYNQICRHCGKPMQGRRDKKYCDDSCRSLHHSPINSPNYNLMRNTHTILRKNRRILCLACSHFGSSSEVQVAWMLDRGFSFQYCTQLIHQDNHEEQFICYDFAYHWINPGIVKIYPIAPTAKAA